MGKKWGPGWAYFSLAKSKQYYELLFLSDGAVYSIEEHQQLLRRSSRWALAHKDTRAARLHRADVYLLDEVPVHAAPRVLPPQGRLLRKFTVVKRCLRGRLPSLRTQHPSNILKGSPSSCAA